MPEGVGLALVLLWRIHDDEAFMQQAFGTEWETYAHTHGGSFRLYTNITAQSWRQAI
jgi:hypothetical protein